MRRFLEKLLKVLLTFITVGVVAVVLLFASLWVEHGLSLELPLPAGPYTVGRISATWVDSTRIDPYAPSTGENRELNVWIWYPAQHGEGTNTATYLSDPQQQALAEIQGWVLNQFFLRNPASVRGHSVENADFATDKPSYPLVLFNPGIGALTLQYSTLVEDLASRGYIVVGADRPYSTAVVIRPNGQAIHPTVVGNPGEGRVAAEKLDQVLRMLLQVWTDDTSFILNQMAHLNESDTSGRFTGRINLDSVGVAGHSFGGATAVQFCHDDDRCRGGINIDGALHGNVLTEGIDQPFLFFFADYGVSWSSADCTKICEDILFAARRAPTNKLIVTLLGAHHFSFGDGGLTQSRIVRSVLSTLTGQGGLSPRTALASTTRYVGEFFDVHLRGTPREALYSAPLMEGVRVEK